MDLAAKAQHDRLLELQPEGATHPMESCQFCLAELGEDAPAPGGGSVTTYSQEDLDRAVAAANQDLQAQLDKLAAQQATSEVEARVVDAVAAKDEQIATLEKERDDAALAAEQEKAAREGLEAFLTDEAKKQEQAKLIAARKDIRVAELAELKLPDGFVKRITEKAADGADPFDRFAAMSDDEWEARKTEWAALVGKGPGIPFSGGGSDLTGARETAELLIRQQGTGSDGRSLVRSLRELQSAGVDPRTIH